MKVKEGEGLTFVEDGERERGMRWDMVELSSGEGEGTMGGINSVRG